MSKASRIGVSDLHVAVLNEDTPKGTTTYEEPQRFQGLIGITVTPTVASGELYADDQLSQSNGSLVGYEIGMNPEELTLEEQALLLGGKVDDNGGLFVPDGSKAPYVAIMFRSQKSDGEYQYRVIYKVKFQPYDETYATKDSSITYQTPTINGRAFKRLSDGETDYKTDLADDTFFDAPYEKDEEGN